jgi:hypothetical protein
MSNVIDFLEQMGRDAHLRHATGLDLEAALARAGIEPRVQAAIMGGDSQLLESLLGATHTICCMVNVPDEEEEAPAEREEEFEGDDEEVEEGEEEADDK